MTVREAITLRDRLPGGATFSRKDNSVAESVDPATELSRSHHSESGG